MLPLDFLTEIRFLNTTVIAELGNMLEINNSWKAIMDLIPDDPWQPGENLPDELSYQRKYTSDEISLIAGEICRERRTGFEILVEEWGTSGRKRPCVKDLINLLNKAGLIRAADHLLGVIGETANGTATEEFVRSQLETGSSRSDQEEVTDRSDLTETLNLNDVEIISYSVLLSKTRNFNDISIEAGGCMVGKGAFAMVFKGDIGPMQKSVAIKRLYNNELRTKEQFKTEVDILSKCNHKNVLTLEAVSIDGPQLCLVYAYMCNGSLNERLSCLKGTEPLSWNTRLMVAEQAAEGITYLHTNFSTPIVHRDIKSANILLDNDFTPKIGDFGIVRTGGTGTQTQFTTTAFGTSHYMAPEAFGGDVSVKMDTFSYAIDLLAPHIRPIVNLSRMYPKEVDSMTLSPELMMNSTVLLELLTGLPPYDEQRDDRDLLSHVGANEDDLPKLIDLKCQTADVQKAKLLFELADLCTEKKKTRPTMESTLQKLRQIIGS